MKKQLTASSDAKNDGFVSLCPNWTSPARATRSKALARILREALELFFECVSREEVRAIVGWRCVRDLG